LKTDGNYCSTSFDEIRLNNTLENINNPVIESYLDSLFVRL